MAASSDAASEFKPETLRGSAGFFRVGQQRSGAWWLLDPAGEPWWARAVSEVRPAASEGEQDAAARLRRWGFNALGPGTDEAVREDGLPWIASAEFCGAGATIRGGRVRLPDVFDPRWAQQARAHAAKVCAPLAGRTDVLGWLSDGALEWGETAESGRPMLLQTCLSLEPALAAYHAAWEFVLAPHGGRIESLGRAWQAPLTNKEVVRALTRTERGLTTRGYLRDDARWTRELARRYFMLTSAALREHAPQHLLLGARSERPAGAAVQREAVYPAVDVTWWRADELAAGYSGPVLAGDFSWTRPEHDAAPAKARGRRLTSVERMLRRGRAALEQLARHPAVMGYAWSRWADRADEQPPFAGGLVHVNGAEAREHTELLTEINGRVETLRRGAGRPRSGQR